jgi:hypothetical protein
MSNRQRNTGKSFPIALAAWEAAQACGERTSSLFEEAERAVIAAPAESLEQVSAKLLVLDDMLGGDDTPGDEDREICVTLGDGTRVFQLLDSIRADVGRLSNNNILEAHRLFLDAERLSNAAGEIKETELASELTNRAQEQRARACEQLIVLLAADLSEVQAKVEVAEIIADEDVSCGTIHSEAQGGTVLRLIKSVRADLIRLTGGRA